MGNRILIVDGQDLLADASYYAELLKTHGFEVEVIRNIKEFIDVRGEWTYYDMVLFPAAVAKGQLGQSELEYLAENDLKVEGKNIFPEDINFTRHKPAIGYIGVAVAHLLREAGFSGAKVLVTQSRYSDAADQFIRDDLWLEAVTSSHIAENQVYFIGTKLDDESFIRTIKELMPDQPRHDRQYRSTTTTYIAGTSFSVN